MAPWFWLVGGHDLGVGHVAPLVHLVAVMEEAAWGLRGPGGDARPDGVRDARLPAARGTRR